MACVPEGDVVGGGGLLHSVVFVPCKVSGWAVEQKKKNKRRRRRRRRRRGEQRWWEVVVSGGTREAR
ncbi:hypothetical protein CKAH01_12494 [Colletotrichum kahawae]|uniref:Uncharacterized protein n=1 Tax=Colletotrichum kahawae TaxID=34407 RepID=A0AAE0DCN6_COLKA|nr:hypothetical protein CKAH01_12494 [Colletotrichum kahawae]